MWVVWVVVVCGWCGWCVGGVWVVWVVWVVADMADMEARRHSSITLELHHTHHTTPHHTTPHFFYGTPCNPLCPVFQWPARAHL